MKKQTDKEFPTYKKMRKQIAEAEAFFQKGERQLSYRLGTRLGRPEFLPSFYEIIATYKSE